MQRKSIHILLVFLMTVMGVTLVSAVGAKQALAGKESTLTIRVGHLNPPGDPAYEAWALFGKRMEEETKGRVKVEIHPQGELGGERENIEQVKLGVLDMSRTSGAMPGFAPIHRVFFLPYLFKDEEHMWRVTDGPLGDYINEVTLKTAKVKIVAYWSTGVRHFFHRTKPIRTPDDSKGIKLRVMEDRVFMETFPAIGALPTTMRS